MKRLIIIAGLPGTGKSTFSNTYFKNNSIIISSDEIRFKHTGDYSVLLNDMSIVYKEMCALANEAFLKNENIDVILDSTMLNDERRNFFLDRIKGQDETLLYLLKVRDINTILERNKKRPKDKWVPEDIIYSMNSNYKLPSEDNKKRYNKIVEVYVD